MGRAGRTYDHVPPGPVPPPDPSAPPGECDFSFDRSGYRVPAIIVSPWVEPGSVYNDEYRHTSLIATLRKVWGLGEAFTQRDASARTFDHVFLLATPRDPTVGEGRGATLACMDDGPRSCRQSPERPGQGHGPALIAKAREMDSSSHRSSTIRERHSNPDSSCPSSGTSPDTSSRSSQGTPTASTRC